MARYIIAYFATIVVFFIIDFIWLGTVAKTFYRNEIGPMLLDKFNIPVAILFYVTYCIGIVIFAVAPALSSETTGEAIKTALIWGALFGFFTYATYDFTNLATLKGYTTKVAIVDTAWGTCLVAATASLGTWITRFFQ